MVHHISSLTSWLALSALVLLGSAQDAPFSLCTDGLCQDCPQSVTSGGTGYPACVVYNSDDVFASGDFPAAEGGGYAVYFDIAQPNPTCATIVKSPADTSVQGCGVTIGAYQNSACAKLAIRDTFMVQFCCGNGDCTAAGVPNPVKTKRGLTYRISAAESSGSSGISSTMLKYKNGTIIPPIQQGDMVMPLTERSTNLQPRKDDGCVYTAEAGKEQYTRPADNTQTVRAATVNGGTGGGTAEISTSRTQEWSTSMSAGVNILEIVSASVSFEMSESVTDSTAYTFSVPAGQTGQVGFTANLRCTSGTIDQCSDGTTTSGEICSPYNGSDGKISGTYAVISTA